MEEITLTGGTMSGNPNAHSHSHSHSHGHGQHCEIHGHQGGPPQGGLEMTNFDSPSLDDLVSSSNEEISRSLFTLVRFGRFEALEPLFIKLKEVKKGDNGAAFTEILKTEDDGGHALLHWAAKRVDDIRFLQTLIELVIEFKLNELLNRRSTDNVGMCPLHWSCTEDGSIPLIALLLKHGADMEAKDSSGCTPLLIAAQYGRVEVVAYLLKNGANIQAVDSSWDTALHWAAYKGSIHVCGLLAFHQTLNFTTQDAYGQTPLHLAALRGHTTVCRYILQRIPKTDILFLKDKNERTPLDLAIHKNRPTVEAVLREAMAAAEDPRGHFFRKTLFANVKGCFSLKNWKLWMGMSPGMDDMDEPVRFPYYFVLFNYAVHIIFMLTVFAPVFNAEKGIMWDKSGWLLWNFANAFLSWFFFYKTVKTPPGYMDDSLPGIAAWRQRYEETLEAYADEKQHGNIDSLPPLCHTCHVARPLRSKHCRIQRKCVLLFDHYCPFVDNTVGLYNYRYFYWFLVFMTIALFSFGITLFQYLRRYTADHSMPWFTLVMGIEVCLTFFPICGMCLYHTQLAMVNLSTNEHMNLRKYKYLYPTVNGKRQYKNPWFKGFFGNFMDRMQPSEKCYMIAAERQGLTQPTNSGENLV